MFSDKWKRLQIGLAFAALLALIPFSAWSIGGKAETPPPASSPAQGVQTSDITLKQLANLFWPDSTATEAQQQEALENLLGKRVTWTIKVAQIQREGSGYLIQGQSDRDMLGTFSYITPQNEAEKEAILKASMGSELEITGVVDRMQMRHIILKPATVILK